MTPDKNQKREYSIQEYDPEWPKKFEEIKDVIKEIFSKKALQIEHIGSTSILGMKAKPLIDVLVVVEKKEPFAFEKEKMMVLGYEWGENYIAPDTLIFYKTEGDRKTENIHICLKDSFKAKQFIITRDYLRTHPERAKLYGEIKEKLKKQFPDDYPSYRAGKQDFVDETERLAYAKIVL
jgi:GrpB-like predicted nucleotidyltransferase (UPF0157 family)